MSQTSPLRKRAAGTLGRPIQTKIETQTLRESQLSYQFRPSGNHGRVRGAVMRAQRVLAADDDLLLPASSVYALERAVSTFLQDCRLGVLGGKVGPLGVRVASGGHAVSGDSSSRPSTTRGSSKYRRATSRRNPERLRRQER